MIDIPMRTKAAIDRSMLDTLNKTCIPSVSSAQSPVYASAPPIPPSVRPQSSVKRRIPPLLLPVQKGQKVPIETSSPLRRIKACLGWNVKNPQCDVDVSAFLLGDNGKVPGDSWFVFYGQTKSPDESTEFHQETGDTDRESITIDFGRLSPAVKKIVFVLTINEAFEKRFHFGMIEDAYIRIINQDGQKESVSFKMDEYYSNVISMMIGEIYQHNGIWKFNAIGNGVAKDLAGLCSLYGVEIES